VRDNFLHPASVATICGLHLAPCDEEPEASARLSSPRLLSGESYFMRVRYLHLGLSFHPFMFIMTSCTVLAVTFRDHFVGNRALRLGCSSWSSW